MAAWVRRVALVVVLAVVAVSGLPGVPASSPAYAATTATPRFIPPDADWLTAFNYYRAIGGLGKVTEDAARSYGAQLHSHYMLMTNLLTHEEDPNSPYYTPEGAAVGKRSLISAAYNYKSDRQWIDLWLTAPFHGVPMLRPALDVSGFGLDQGSNGLAFATLDVGGKTSSNQAPAAPVRWPEKCTTVPALVRWTE